MQMAMHYYSLAFLVARFSVIFTRRDLNWSNFWDFLVYICYRQHTGTSTKNNQYQFPLKSLTPSDVLYLFITSPFCVKMPISHVSSSALALLNWHGMILLFQTIRSIKYLSTFLTCGIWWLFMYLTRWMRTLCTRTDNESDTA
jgi:hypothetical protein